MNPIFAGIAGEYFVAGELSRRGYIASITLRNTANIDILASNGEKTINIQVKTMRRSVANGWAMGNIPLEPKKEWKNTFYVFVELPVNLNEKINYYIIPKNILNKKVEANFQKVIKTPRRNGMPRKTKFRFFEKDSYPEFNTKKYADNWDQLFK